MVVFRRTVGNSMLPGLRPDRLVVGWKRVKKLRPGEVVIVQHDGIEKIKRIKQVEQNQIYIVGDNTLESTDSRHFGWVPMEHVIAKVIWPRERGHSQT
jgi:nickel-type superoxide dismutase maturation protease